MLVYNQQFMETRRGDLKDINHTIIFSPSLPSWVIIFIQENFKKYPFNLEYRN